MIAKTPACRAAATRFSYILCASLLAILSNLPVPARAEVPDAHLEGLEYRLVGPYRGGRVTAVAGVTGDRLTYYMGATGGGVWKTTNAGQSWENVSDEHFGVGSIGAIDVAASDPNVIYVGSGESPYRGVASSHGDGIYRSTDAGKTWTNVGLKQSRQISAVRIHPTNPDIIYAAVQGSPWAPTKERGIYRSRDGGESWQRVLFIDENTGAVDLKFDRSNPRILYAAMWDHQRQPWEIRSGGSGSGIWKSTDGGNSWEELTKGLPELKGKIGVAPSPAKPGRVWAIVEASEKPGLYRSDDGGETWKLVNKNRRLFARSWYYMHVFADPVDANTVYVLNSGFYRSLDGGATTERITNPHGDNHDLWVNPQAPANMINGNDGGATITFDGGQTWSSIYNQPTAQFYRLTIDNAFPYRLYSGQQDNSSVGIRSRGLDGSIGPADFDDFGGCESAFVAMDPGAANPRHYYANCYLGHITGLDIATGEERDIRVYPETAFGVSPRERKYRFNWNAPVVVSSHDASVIYHAGNMVFRSTDRGQSWQTISPDLTRDEDDKQGPMGRPITNEVSENYNTIAYLAESPHDADNLWVGTDDGLVQVTRDGGASWQDVTPRGVKDGLINAIEISPHDGQRVYLAHTRYKYNDHRPHIYRSDDGGRRWRDIAGGIPDDTFVRVVREDPVRPGLLFAGTETGVYVSFDDGGEWQELQLKLPRVPVTDIKIKGNDLVLSTQGRAFWILDDISPLRQMNDDIPDAELHLFQPATAYRFMTRGRTVPGQAKNPPNGAYIYYSLKEEPAKDAPGLMLEVLDAEGAVLRTIAPKKEDEGKPPLPAKAGLNRYVWDLTRDPVVDVPGLFAIGGERATGKIAGHLVPPGTYRLRLTMGDTSVEQDLQVTLDPRATASDSDIARQQEILADAKDMLDSLHRAVNDLKGLKERVTMLAKQAEAAGREDDIKEAADSLTDTVEKWLDANINPERTFFQDVLNWPDKIDSDLQFLYGTVADSPPPVTRGMEDRLADLTAAFTAVMAERDRIANEDMAAFNARYRELDLPAVMLPAAEGELAE